MDDQPTMTQPGTGLLVTDGGVPQPVHVRHLDDATVARIAGSLLVGGEPGGGKAARLRVLAADAALSSGADDAGSGAPSGTGE